MKINRSLRSCLSICAFAFVIVLGGCGPYPANVSSKWDIWTTSADHYALRIAKLPLEYYPRLAKFTGVKDIDFKHEADDARLAALARLSFPNLEYVYLAGSPRFTDEGLSYLLSANFPRLRGFTLNNTAITDRTLIAIAAHRSINGINITGCPRITRDGLSALIQSPRVTSINFSTENLSADQLLALLRTSPPSKNFLLWDPAKKLTQAQTKEIATTRNLTIDLRQNSDPAFP